MPKVIIQFQGQEWSVELKEGSNVIGRSSKCGIPVRDVNMSREHSEIQLVGGVATVFDKGSMNGTLLNGTKVLERKLSPGDKIQIGASTIWFEERKGGPAPAATPLAPAGLPDDSTRPHVEPVGAKPVTSTGQKKTEGRRSVALLIKDYSTWGRMGGPSGGVILAIATVVVVVVIGVVAARALGGGAGGPPEDPDNLLGTQGGFEFMTDKPTGWELRSGLASKLAIDAGVAHKGKASMVLEKAGEAGDLVVDCALSQEHPLGSARTVSLSAWAKTDGFGGAVALKVTWLTGVRGATLLEEYSEPVARPADWTLLEKDFAAPAGAGAYAVALSAMGRSGRVWFDDVRLVAKPGAEGRESALGGFGVAVGPSGAFQVFLQGRRVLTNVHLALASDKEGVSPQAFVAKCSVKVDEKAIDVEGVLLSPVDLREIKFTQKIMQGQEDSNDIYVAYTLPAESLKQIERLVVRASVPRAERVSGLPAANEPGTVRLVARAEGVDVVLEYFDLTRVTAVRERGAQVLVHAFPVERGVEKVTVGFKVRPGTAGLLQAAATDPLKAAEDEIEKRQNFSGALAILKAHVGTVRDPAMRTKVLAESARLEEQERRDWNDVQAASFRASISRRSELFDLALMRLGNYQRQWNGEPYAAKSQSARDQLAQLAAAAAGERDVDRAKRLLERARAYAQAGKRKLASEVCEILLERYAETEAAKEAADILKALQGQ